MNSKSPVLDWDTQVATYGEEMLREAITIFKNEIQGLLDKIKSSYEANNNQELIRGLHTLKGQCSYGGFLRLKEIVVPNLEKARAGEKLEPAFLESIKKEIETIFYELKKRNIQIL